MSFKMNPTTGALLKWTASNGTGLLYPQETTNRGSSRNTRGNSHVCCPIFGKMPDGKLYEDLQLPNHGFARDGGWYDRNPIQVEQTAHFLTTELTCYNKKLFPWNHTLQVSYEQLNASDDVLRQATTVERLPSCKNLKKMPLSLGFHPYFATHGISLFILEFGATTLSSSEDFPRPSEALWIPRADLNDEPLKLTLAHGSIEFSLAGGRYTHIVVWSDNPTRYVCVEPVMLGQNGGHYDCLEPGGTRYCACTMSYRPC